MSGRPALVPQATHIGDMVCLLCTCPVPVVLRKVDDHYLLVGECYLDDFMQHEDMVRYRENRRLIEFDIR